MSASLFSFPSPDNAVVEQVLSYVNAVTALFEARAPSSAANTVGKVLQKSKAVRQAIRIRCKGSRSFKMNV